MSAKERPKSRGIRVPVETDQRVAEFARRNGLSINGGYNVLIHYALDRMEGKPTK